MIQKACYQAIKPMRVKADMEAGIAELARIRKEEMPKMTIADTSMVYNTDWKCAIENWNLLDLAEAAAKAALMREETRGHMYNPDFPEKDDANWLCNIRNFYKDGEITCEKSAVVTV